MFWWLRRSCFVLCLLQAPLHAQSAQGLMSGPLVSTSPAGRNPEQGAFHLVGDIGVSVVDSLAQTTRFASNIFALDLEGAMGNVGQLVTKRSIDSMIVQFVENLPTVLERDLYKSYKPSSKKAVGAYFTDSKLDAKESAALFNFVLAASGRSPSEAAELIKELKSATAMMRQGGSKGSVQLGRELGGAMKAAIAQAPKPVPVIGNPLNAKRRVSITKGFLHGVIQTQGVPYARAAIEEQLDKGRKAGLEVTGLSDSMIRSTMDNASANLGMRDCLAKALGNDELVACAKNLGDNRNKMIGSALESLGPSLRSGKLGVVYQSEELDEELKLGIHVGNAIQAHAGDVKLLEQSGSSQALNRIVNTAAVSVVKDVGGKAVAAKLAPHFSSSPESAARVKDYGNIVVDRFSQRLKLLQGGDDLVKQVKALVAGGATAISDNKALDARLLGPFKETMADAQVKAALLGIFLEKVPVSPQLRAELHKSYAEALAKKGPLTPSATLPAGFRDFLKSFDGAMAKVSDPAASVTTIAHLKGLVDPASTELNKIVTSFSPGVSGIVSFYMNCKPGERYCDSVVEPHNAKIKLLREANAALVGASFGEECQDSAPAIAEELFKGVDAMPTNVIQSPRDALLGLASSRSQQAVDCLLAGMAGAKGLQSDEMERLHQVLSESRERRPEDRRELVENLHAYLKSPTAGGAEQGKLLSTSEAIAKDLVKGYAAEHIRDFSERPKNIATLFKSEANREIVDRFVGHLVDNTDLIDENTQLPLKDYARKLAEAPLERGSVSDLAIARGLDKTLKDPDIRRDLLTLALGVDDALLPAPRAGFLGPGLEARLREAYAKADLSGPEPKFNSSVDPGVRSFLKEFDSAAQNLDKHRGPNESVLKFFSSVIKPESRVLDGIVANASKGIRDLLMSMISCKDGPTELCSGCLGDKGSWILSDPKKGTTEVLVAAPMGQLLNILKIGLQPGSDPAMNATCAAAIPATIERIVSQPQKEAAPLGLMKDIGLFVDGLARAENQTALNCITAQLAEKMFLANLRTKHAGTETAVRGLLSHAGVPSHSALLAIRGDTIFRTLEKRNSNPELLRRKSDLIAALRGSMKQRNSASRHQVASALQDLSRTVIVGSMTDPDIAYVAANGAKFPSALRTWAEGADTLSQGTLQCIDKHYSEGFLPAALYAGEDVSRQISSSMRPWVDAGGALEVPVVSSVPIGVGPAPASADTSTQVEACVQSGSFFVDPAPSLASSGLSSPAWVGGYKHTLKDFQDTNRAEGSAALSPAGEAAVLAHASDYQTFLNHMRSRESVVGKGRGAKAVAGDFLFEVQYTGPEAKRTLSHLKGVFDFPAAKMLSALQAFKDSPSPANRTALIDLVLNNCAEVRAHWNAAKLEVQTHPESQNSH